MARKAGKKAGTQRIEFEGVVIYNHNSGDGPTTVVKKTTNGIVITNSTRARTVSRGSNAIAEAREPEQPQARAHDTFSYESGRIRCLIGCYNWDKEAFSQRRARELAAEHRASEGLPRKWAAQDRPSLMDEVNEILARPSASKMRFGYMTNFKEEDR
jgi:hypothetical protein